MRYTKKRISRKTNLGKRRKSYARKYKIRTKKRGGTYVNCEGKCMKYARSCNKGRGIESFRCKECINKCEQNLRRNVSWYYDQDPGDIDRSVFSDL